MGYEPYTLCIPVLIFVFVLVVAFAPPRGESKYDDDDWRGK